MICRIVNIVINNNCMSTTSNSMKHRMDPLNTSVRFTNYPPTASALSPPKCPTVWIRVMVNAPTTLASRMMAVTQSSIILPFPNRHGYLKVLHAV